MVTGVSADQKDIWPDSTIPLGVGGGEHTSQPCVYVCELVRVHSLLVLCACNPLCVCVCVRVHVSAILCACVFAMLCMKMLVNFHMFCMLVYLRTVCFSLSSVVKRFEFLKALYKFPIIIIFVEVNKKKLLERYRDNKIHSPYFVKVKTKIVLFYACPYQPFWEQHHPATETKQKQNGNSTTIK